MSELRPATRDAAQSLQRQFADAGKWIMWLVSRDTSEQPGKAVAWAVVADARGGTKQPGELIADTLEDLRAMLPSGLRRSEPLAFWWPDVVETWD